LPSEARQEETRGAEAPMDRGVGGKEPGGKKWRGKLLPKLDG